MARRKRGNTLQRWEVAIIKAMLARGGYNDQDILSIFHAANAIHQSRPHFRHSDGNHTQSSQGRVGRRIRRIPCDMARCLIPQTGLSLRGDELLVKAREAMIAAVHVFNGRALHSGLNYSSSLASLLGRIFCTHGINGKA